MILRKIENMGKALTLLLIGFGLAFIFISCENGEMMVQRKAYNQVLKRLLSHSVKEVGVKQVFDQQHEMIFLDTRSLEEFSVSRIAGAKRVGFKEFKQDLVRDIPVDTKIVVYCSIGMRSEKVVEKMEELGYKDVSNLYGGIFEWVNQGYPVVDKNNDTTSEVHGFSRIWSIWLDRGRVIYD